MTNADSYTGAVVVGGPIDVRELSTLTIAKLAVGPLSNNAFLLRCRTTGEGLLIDAAAEPDRLAELARIGGDAVRTIVTTHWHPDHWQSGLAATVADTGARTMTGSPDDGQIDVETDRVLHDGDTVHFGEIELSVIGLRGHTEGSIALYYSDPAGHGHLFTGDSLFPGGPGRTTSGEDFDSLMEDLQRKVFDRFPDETWFYPGHGDDSTLGAERPSIPEWLARRW